MFLRSLISFNVTTNEIFRILTLFESYQIELLSKFNDLTDLNIKNFNLYRIQNN